MKRHFVYAMGFSFAISATVYGQAGDGKPLQFASREPAFYAIMGSHIERTEARSVAALRRHIALQLKNATVPDALHAIEEQTSLRFAFKPAILPQGPAVSLDAQDITVAAALTQILLDADVDVEIAPYGLASIVPRRAYSAAPDTTTGVIVGHVTDAKTHEGISYTVVTVESTSRSATANDSGSFRLQRMPAGVYTIVVRRVGYVAARRTVTIVGGQVTTIDFALEQAAGALDQVVVTGALMPATLKSLPTPITVVSDSEIAQQQPRTVNEIFRQTVPTAVGFDIFSNPNATLLTVRGATDLNVGATQMKTFIDGIEVAKNAESPVDPSSIDHIEVIRGPEAAAIYGSEAIDGVVQIFTKHGDAAHSNRPAVDAEVAVADVQTPYAGFRGILRQTYSGDIRGGTRDANYTVGGGYTQTNNYLPFGAYSAQSTPSVYGGLHYSKAITTLDLSARYHIVDAPSTSNPELAVTEPRSSGNWVPPYMSDEYTNATIGATLGIQPLPWWHNALTIGYDETNWNEVQRKPRLTTPADTELAYAYSNINKISVRYISSLTQHIGPNVSGTLTFGADYWAESSVATSSYGVLNTTGEITTDPSVPFNTSRYPSHNTGAFTQAQIDLFDALFITAGLRADWNSDFGDSIGVPLSPRVGLAYSHSLGFSTIKLRTSWGSAIFPPYPGEKDGFITNGFIQLAAPHLGPERQHGGDGGFDILFGNVGSLSATYYNQTAINLISQVTLPDTTPTTQFQTVGTVKNSGVELEGRVSIGRLALRVMYGYSRSRVDQLNATYTGDLRVGDQTLDVPRHNGGATLSTSLWRGASAAAGLTYVGPWTEYDAVKEGTCFSYYFSGDQTHCPPGVAAAFNQGNYSTRVFLVQYPSLVKGKLSLTQAMSAWASAFISVENIGDNQNYEQSNNNARVGRISTVGLRLHY